MKTAPEPLAAAPQAAAAGESEAAYDQKRATTSRRSRMIFITDRVVATLLPLVGWQLLSDNWIGGKWISSPLAVVDRLASMARDGSLEMHTWQTLDEALLGLLCGLVLGIAIGVALGLSKHRRGRASDREGDSH